MKRLILSALVFFGGSVEACDGASVALRYLEAIDAMNWPLMRDLLAPSAHYTDPTMTFYERPAIDLTGRDAIVEFWRSSSEDSGTSDIRYTVTGCFETAGYHMINLDILITVSGEFWNVNKDKIQVPGELMSVIRVERGKVTEHLDYVGYAAAEAVISDLRTEYGAARR